jgi:hypothetical protein
MARERKPIELKPVAETPVAEADIVRLGVDPTVLRVIPERVDHRPPPDARLEVPDFEGAETLRSFEPGVEVLLDAEVANVITDEVDWGKVKVERTPVPWGWFVVLGLVLTGAVAWSVVHVLRAEREVKEVQEQVSQNVADSEAADREIARSLEIMEETVRKFCEARSINELAPLVRHAARVRPLMEAHYAKTPLRPLGFVRVKDLQPADFGSVNSFWVIKVVRADGRAKPLLVEQESATDFRVDWETAVTYQPLNWDRYAVEWPPGTSLDFRVQVEADHFFSHEFADEARWSSFRLTTPGGEETLFGYAEKNSMVEIQLRDAIKNNSGKPVAMILRLGLPAGLKSRRGLVIEKVLSKQWLYVEPPNAGP